MSNELQISAQQFDPIARMLAANAMSQSLSFCTERKYLDSISEHNSEFQLVEQPTRNISKEPYWIRITQIGRPLNDKIEDCFTAIQKILSSCFLPYKSQLIFLVHNENKISNLYLGIRPIGGDIINDSFAENLNQFIRGIWPGIQSEQVINVDFLQKKMQQGQNAYNSIYSLTGIPSMEDQYKSTYPATIDKLIAGMHNEDFTYMVIADPLPENEIDSILYTCRDLNGQAESLKSFNFSENKTLGNNTAYSEAKTITESVTESTTKEKTKTKYKLLGAGLLVASALFPPAGAITTALAVGNSILRASQNFAGIDLLTDFAPRISKQNTKAYAEGFAKSNTIGFSQSQSTTLSQNIVNKHIESISEHLFYHSKRFETGKAIGSWKVGVYLMANTKPIIECASIQLRSILSGEESIFEPIRINEITKYVYGDRFNSFGNFVSPRLYINVNDRLFSHPFGNHFTELKTVLTTKELSYLINFPLRSVPGISVIDSSPEFSLNLPEKKEDKTIGIGKLLYGGSPTNMEYHIPVSSLSRHTLLSGINGSGKTNTVQAVLNSIKREIPFLVIEPAKTEYVDWALEYNKQHPEHPIDIYIPGCKKYKTGFVPKKLKLNPFELVWLDKEQEPNVLTHIDRLKSTFATAFPMYDILPVLMEDLIYTVYQNKSTDWLGREPKFGETLPPTLNSMSISVDKVISNRQYEERIERNMKACLNTRIDSLKRGWKGEMLNTVHSTPWNELFEKPCVINLSYVGDDVDKSFFMALILQFLYEYRSALAETGKIDFNDNSCKHLTVIEEAHRVMAKCDNQELPQYKSAMMFSNMLSEIRAYGEGMFLVDQVPTRLIPDAIKNTNLKITHRLVAEDDCKAIAESMGLSEEQRKVIAKLMTGQCIVSSSLSTDTYWVKVNKMK